MSRIALFFAASFLCAMDKQPPTKKQTFTAKPYLYAWPEEHSVKFCPEIHNTPWLGLITNTPQILILEKAAMAMAGDTRSAQQIDNVLNFQATFGFYNAVPAFVACCEKQKHAAAYKKQRGVLKK